MKEFTYTIIDPVGIHARPAGLLAKAAKALDSTVTITKSDGKSAQATKLMALMGMGIKQGDTVTLLWRAAARMPTPLLWNRFSKVTCKRQLWGVRPLGRRPKSYFGGKML